MSAKIQTPQKSLDQILTPQNIPCRISEIKNSQKGLSVQNYAAGIRGNSLQGTTPQKNTCQIFLPKKIPESENFKPPKSHLQSEIILPPPPSRPPGRFSYCDRIKNYSRHFKDNWQFHHLVLVSMNLIGYLIDSGQHTWLTLEKVW